MDTFQTSKNANVFQSDLLDFGFRRESMGDQNVQNFLLELQLLAEQVVHDTIPVGCVHITVYVCPDSFYKCLSDCALGCLCCMGMTR